MIRRRPLLTLAAATLPTRPAATLAQSPPQPPPPQQRTARLQPGTRTLHERVLTAAEAPVRATPGAAGPPTTALPPLTPLHIYDRRQGPDQRTWLQVGRAPLDDTMGWLRESDTLPWPRPLTARLLAPQGRLPLLLFHDRAGLDAALAPPDTDARLAALAQVAAVAVAPQAIAQPASPATLPLLAVELPDGPQHARHDYLLPVLAAQRSTSPRPHVAIELAAQPASSPPPPRPHALGIAFVVDTSASMDPYIARVRTALGDLVRAAPARAGGPVRYALVAFRNSLAVQPKLEYLTRVYASFADSADPDRLAARLAEMSATSVDSGTFDEDSFAGLRAALQELDWTGLDGRAIVLVTDAGSRAAGDPRSATGFTEAQMAALARASGAAVLVLHLRTTAGRANHAAAESQYTAVTRRAAPTGRPYLYPIAQGGAAELDLVMRRLLADLIELVREPRPAPATPPPPVPALPLGHVLPLAWVRRPGKSVPPDLLRGWAADGYRGATPGEVAGLRLLMPRHRLAALDAAVAALVTAGRVTALLPGTMFAALRHLASPLLRDPAAGVATLRDLLGEELDGLPYTSEIADIGLAEWQALSVRGETVELLDRLEAKRRRYAAFLADTQGWQHFDTRPDPAEAVYAVPLEALP